MRKWQTLSHATWNKNPGKETGHTFSCVCADFVKTANGKLRETQRFNQVNKIEEQILKGYEKMANSEPVDME